MKIVLQAHVFHPLSVGDTRSLLDFALATKVRRGEVVGVARDIRIEGGVVLELPSQGAYGRTPDGITRYPLAEVGPRWADQARAAALWVREDPVLQRLAQTVGRVLGDRAIEVIALRDALLLTTLRTVSDVAGPEADPLAQTVGRTTVVVLPRGLTLTGQISALGGAAHVIGERFWRIARGLPEGHLRQACRQARVVVLPPASEGDRIRVRSTARAAGAGSVPAG
jgi:hypothetical protein